MVLELADFAIGASVFGAGVARGEIDLGFEGEGDAISGEIDFDYGGEDALPDLEDFSGIFDEVVADLADMHEAILVDADIDEGTESGHIGDESGEAEAWLEVGNFFDAFGKTEGFELLAGVAAWFGEFVEDIFEGGEADIGGEIFFEGDFRAFGGIAEEIGDRATEIGGHFVDEIVAFGVDRAGVEGVRAATDAEEPGGLFEGFGAEARDLLDFFAGGEGAMFVAVRDEIGGDTGIEAGDVGEEMFGGGIEFDADAIDATDDDIIESAFEGILVDIVLVLTDPDGFGVEFDQFGEGIHEAPSDGDGASDGEIFVGKLFAGDIARGVNGGAAFADHDHGDGGGEGEFTDERFGFAGGGSVADGDGFHFKFGDHGFDHGLGFGEIAGAFFGVDDIIGEEFALAIEEDDFAAGAEAGIDAEGDFLAEG